MWLGDPEKFASALRSYAFLVCLGDEQVMLLSNGVATSLVSSYESSDAGNT
jgi:hypothetical protein